MGYLSVYWAYGLLYVTLFCFVALVICYELYASKGSLTPLKGALFHPTEELIACDAQHGWLELGLSLFASLAGNWLLFLPADVGALYSWPGILGYALAVSLPYLLLMWLAPMVKRLTGETGFSGTDYLLIRYGRAVQAIFAVVSISAMFFSLTVELTTIGSTFQAITGNEVSPAGAVIPLSAITLLYTLYGGLRTSIFTDKYQGCLILLLGVPIVATVFVTTASGNSSWWEIAEAPTPPGDCFVAGLVLILSLWPIYLLDQGIWQRLLAAKTPRDLNIALIIAAVLSFGSVFVFGVSGMACRRTAGAREQITGNFSVFQTLAVDLSAPWLGVLTVLAVACVASSVDTYQAALVSVFAHDLKSANLSFNWARLALFLGNAAAVALACTQLPILALSMASNMVCVVVSGSFLSSLFPNVVACGILCGIPAGFLTALICGLCFSGSIKGAFEFFAPTDFSSLSYLIAFLLMPVIGFAVAVGLSKIYPLLRAAIGVDGSAGDTPVEMHAVGTIPSPPTPTTVKHVAAPEHDAGSLADAQTSVTEAQRKLPASATPGLQK